MIARNSAMAIAENADALAEMLLQDVLDDTVLLLQSEEVRAEEEERRRQRPMIMADVLRQLDIVEKREKNTYARLQSGELGGFFEDSGGADVSAMNAADADFIDERRIIDVGHGSTDSSSAAVVAGDRGSASAAAVAASDEFASKQEPSPVTWRTVKTVREAREMFAAYRRIVEASLEALDLHRVISRDDRGDDSR